MYILIIQTIKQAYAHMHVPFCAGIVQGVIKAGDTLIFDVELLGFHEKPKERWEMTAEELMADATKIKVCCMQDPSPMMCSSCVWTW